MSCSFSAFDQDDSGTIDFNEFLIAFSITSKGKLEDRLNWAFNYYDLDNNNYIDSKELRKVLNVISNNILEIHTEFLLPNLLIAKNTRFIKRWAWTAKATQRSRQRPTRCSRILTLITIEKSRDKNSLRAA